MNKERELLIQAIDAYDVCCDENDAYYERLNNAFEEIRNYLICEPEDKPVAYINLDEQQLEFATPFEFKGSCFRQGKLPLYLHPPRPKPARKPMTMEDLLTLARRCDYENDKVYVDEELCVDSFDYKNL